MRRQACVPRGPTPYAADEIDGPVRVVVPLDWVIHGYGEAGIEIVVPEESVRQSSRGRRH